jgi:hypothetical protein
MSIVRRPSPLASPSWSSIARALVAGGSLVLGACADRSTAVLTGVPTAAPSSMVAFLSVSSSAVLLGDEVTVSANVRIGAATPRVGSYLARVTYDPTQLRYLGEVPVEGGARALNPESGRITVAGASADGLVSERLFAIRFAVIGAKPLATLALEVNELNDAAFGVRTSSLQRKRTLFLDELASP